MKKNSLFTDHFNNVLNDLQTTGNLEILMKKHSNSTKCNMPTTRISGLGFDKLTFLFIILIIGIILSLVALIFELNFKPNQRNDQEVELSSKEIDKLEKIVRRLLEGPLQEKTENCLKRLLDEHTSYSARQLPYLVKSEKVSNFSIW